jgi:hypothetical protein
MGHVMSEPVKPLQIWHFPDIEFKPSGYGFTEVPKATERNFQVIVDKINELVEVNNEKEANK